jgi:hypothetical protein
MTKKHTTQSENDLSLSDSISCKENLVDFIRQESLSTQPQSSKIVIETYACALWKGFFDMKHKLFKLKDLDFQNAVDMGLLLIDNIFWISYNYSSNLQLTLFLTERGRLLYTEFLHMSRTHKLMQEIHTFPSINDGFQFAIKKSIGALTCKEESTKTKFEKITSYRLVYRKMFQFLNTKYLSSIAEKPWTDDDVNITLNTLNHKMSCAVYLNANVFEFALYNYANALPSLPCYLLFLQLLSDVSEHYYFRTKSLLTHVSQYYTILEKIDGFIQDHLIYVERNTLSCLDKDTLIQKKWKVYLEKVFQSV